MITTKVGVPFTLRGVKYILPPAVEYWQSCEKCVFYNRKSNDGEEFCILKTRYKHYIVTACNRHTSVYQKFKEFKNE